MRRAKAHDEFIFASRSLKSTTGSSKFNSLKIAVRPGNRGSILVLWQRAYDRRWPWIASEGAASI